MDNTPLGVVLSMCPSSTEQRSANTTVRSMVFFALAGAGGSVKVIVTAMNDILQAILRVTETTARPAGATASGQIRGERYTR